VGRIIAVTTSRGGAGKTSLCRILSANLAAEGYRVAIVDADPNRTFSRWHKETYEGPSLTVEHERDENEIVHRLHGLADTHDVVLADTAGFGNQTASMASGASDFVLIPVMADRDNVIEVLKTARQVSSYSKLREREIPIRIVKSRWHPTGLAERATLDDLASHQLAVLVQHLTDLTEFQKMTFTGVVPTTGRIADEAKQIIAELIQLKAVPQRVQAEVA